MDGLVAHLGADDRDAATSSSISGVTTAGRPVTDGPVPPGAARRCGRCRPPSTTGCRRGPCLDLDLVGLPEAQEMVHLDDEIRIAGRPVGDQGAVHADTARLDRRLRTPERRRRPSSGGELESSSCTPRLPPGKYAVAACWPTGTARWRSWRRGAGSPVPARPRSRIISAKGFAFCRTVHPSFNGIRAWGGILCLQRCYRYHCSHGLNIARMRRRRPPARTRTR